MPPITRSLTKTTKNQIDNPNNKRNLEVSPHGCPTKKRSILGDLTNKEAPEQQTKLPTKQSLPTRKKPVKTDLVLLDITEEDPISSQSSQRSNLSTASSYTTADECSVGKPFRRSSRLSKGAPDESSVSMNISPSSDSCKNEINKEDVDDIKIDLPKVLPPGVIDHDYENWLDPASASCYAMDIFDYLKQREEKFKVPFYLPKQPHISHSMRAIVVDWLVEVQEGFELNHESLYLAVKLVDMFLARTSPIQRDLLQLVAATAIFIACKFDERCPPVVDDFLYICDDAYNRKQLIRMEMKILKTIGFDLGAPLSYSFLRRYARCAKLPMDMLTLARYILEASLMDYQFIDQSDSLMAASSLYLALKMKKTSEWDATLQYYSGYKEDELLNLTKKLNKMMITLPNSTLRVIRNKYSHREFFEVAKILPLDMTN